MSDPAAAMPNMSSPVFAVSICSFCPSATVFLISVETIAYHLFGMQNLTAAAYPGIPICNCMHAQPWMQLSYFLLGPIYFIALKVFKVR